MKILPTLFIVLGVCLLLLGGYQLYLRYAPNRLSFKNYTQTTQPVRLTGKESLPKRIIIKAVGINVPLMPAKITNDIWETTDYGASYLVSAPLPGEIGNSIIYGHNWVSIFGNLTKAKPGQQVVIEFSDKSKKDFVIKYTSVVSPAESSILAPSKDKRITLYTCTGFFDSKRFVVVALLNEQVKHN